MVDLSFEDNESSVLAYEKHEANHTHDEANHIKGSGLPHEVKK
jgi:hypothetical protein